jgi:hypothetical protein
MATLVADRASNSRTWWALVLLFGTEGVAGVLGRFCGGACGSWRSLGWVALARWAESLVSCRLTALAARLGLVLVAASLIRAAC